MLLGEKTGRLDEKGRFILSPRERKEIGKNPTLAISPEGYLALCPFRLWQRWLKSVKDPQEFKRNSAQVEFDAQGRVRIPPFLIKRTNLAREVLLIGNGNHFKILPGNRDILLQDPLAAPELERRIESRKEAESCLYSGREVFYVTSDGKRTKGKLRAAQGSFFTFVGRDEQGIIISAKNEHFSRFYPAP